MIVHGRGVYDLLGDIIGGVTVIHFEFVELF